MKTPHKWSDVPRVLHECRPALVLHITQRLQSSLNFRSSHTSSRGFSPRYQHGPRVSLKFGEAGGSLNLRRSIFQNHISGYNIGGHLCSLFIPELKVSEGRRALPCSALLCFAFTKRRQRRLVLPWWAHGVPQLKNSTQSNDAIKTISAGCWAVSGFMFRCSRINKEIGLHLRPEQMHFNKLLSAFVCRLHQDWIIR